MRRYLAILWLSIAVPAALQAQDANVVAMEYYIDSDPGPGNGNSIAFLPGTPLDVNLNVATGGLTLGMHTLVIRAADQNGVWSIQESRPFFVSASSVTADADITYMEYFVDTDSGFTSGVSIPIATGNIQDIIENIPTGSLTDGFHVLHVRALDSDGAWSIRESRPFYVSVPQFTADASIVEMEYFLDTDPGFGAGTDVAITSGVFVDKIENIPTASLTPGFHVVHFRALDSDGSWGIRESRPFFVSIPSFIADGNLAAMEYYLDNDPGPGNGTSISIPSASSLDITENIPTGALTVGFHTLHVRAQDADGVWSVPESRPFFVNDAGTVTQATITEMEYYFDSDPGYGNGTDLALTAATVIDIDALIPTASLSEGFHTLHIRARDNDGVWGMRESRPFFVDALGMITAVEYYFDTDPGIGSATDIPITADDEIDITTTLPTSSLPEGPHTLGIRIGRIDDTWSDAFTVDFSICTMPTADFTTDVVCEGGTTTFTDISTNAAGATYSWDFDNDGTSDDATSGNAAFAYAAAGTYTAALTLDRGGCTHTTTTTVIVESLPFADAGNDQDICPDNTTLAAPAPGVGETGNWTLVTGSGTITNTTSHVSTFTDITSYSNTLEWTVTKTAGGCSDSDQVTIISNQPITAAGASATVSLGATVNTSVQSGATINPGDVLTTAILTAPTKGTATVASDGTINYTPNDGTVGADVVEFELCNQCNKCSSNQLTITIANDAPVIAPTPITVTPGQNFSLNLLTIISDPNENLDPTTLTIIQQPISGAVASIDPSFNLVIDYTGIVFSGVDQLVIEVCDTEGVCSQSTIFINVDLPADPPVKVYNALSPNGDGKHDYLEIENITAYPNNHIYIVNRWGDKVYESVGYNNNTVRFNGTSNRGGSAELPSGTYYYSVDLGKGGSRVTGFLILKR